MNRYQEGHLFVAAVRVLHHQLGAPPSLEELCSMLGISVEAGGATCRSLAQQNILEMIEDPFSVKVIIKDHLLIENLPRDEDKGDSLADEVARFQEKKKSKERDIAAMQAEIERKQQMERERFSPFSWQFRFARFSVHLDLSG